MKPYSPYLTIGVAILMSCCGAANAASAVGDAQRGQALYQTKCIACHSIDYNGIGPAHKGVFGQKAGSRVDYLYSAALKSSKIIWTDKTLDKWLSNPEKLIPGQKMGFMVPSAHERADLIAYLKKEAGQTDKP